jgi:peptidase S24-like
MVNWKRKITKWALDGFDLVVFLIFVLGIILFIRFFVGTPYTVVGYSMNPTFDQGDRIFVEKITQRF